ncbi:uncharacterized protein LOC124151231 [Haliotis rufescens]|uniref:uncharacterized protein LOC124151231 n=1 Tax=Haliotis rufescens TaxID=6454 RepID=UPI00201EFA5C|nr:uncharacterized protein LOC124151231 [Haliotis rufescens]
MAEYIPEESFERYRNCLIAQLCDNKQIASEIELHVDKTDARKRFSSTRNDTEEPGPGSNPEANPRTKAEMLERLVQEVKESLDQVVLASKRAESSTVSRDSAISSNSYRSSTSGGAEQFTEMQAEQDHEPHDPPSNLVRDQELLERQDAAVQTNRRALRQERHRRLHVVSEHDWEEDTVPKEKLAEDGK